MPDKIDDWYDNSLLRSDKLYKKDFKLPVEIQNLYEKLKEKSQHNDSITIESASYPSEIWKEAYREGLISNNEKQVLANEKLTNFSYEELKQVQKELIRSFYNNPKRIVRIITKIMKAFGFNFFKILLKFILEGKLYRSPEEFHGPDLHANSLK